MFEEKLKIPFPLSEINLRLSNLPSYGLVKVLDEMKFVHPRNKLSVIGKPKLGKEQSVLFIEKSWTVERFEELSFFFYTETYFSENKSDPTITDCEIKLKIYIPPLILVLFMLIGSFISSIVFMGEAWIADILLFSFFLYKSVSIIYNDIIATKLFIKLKLMELFGIS